MASALTAFLARNSASSLESWAPVVGDQEPRAPDRFAPRRGRSRRLTRAAFNSASGLYILARGANLHSASPLISFCTCKNLTRRTHLQSAVVEIYYPLPLGWGGDGRRCLGIPTFRRIKAIANHRNDHHGLGTLGLERLIAQL